MQTELQENLRYWLQYPGLDADQWKIAELPITSGGLAFPNLRRQAVVARISKTCLATLPEFVATQAYRETITDKERPELYGRLAPLIGPTPMEVVGDIHNPPLGRVLPACPKSSHASTTHSVVMSFGQNETPFLTRCDMRGCTTCQVVSRPSPRGFRARERGCNAYRGIPLPPCRTACSAGDSNSSWDATLQEQVANARGQAAALRWTPFGVHAASCSWGQVCKRHDRLRDLIAQAARQAGMAAVTEQNMTTAADTPGAVRGIHRADVRIIENDGRQLWVDVKVISIKPKVGIKHALCQAVVARCKQYGQGPPERSELHGKMIPFVAEAHGKLAPMAETFTSYLITRQAKVIEERRDVTPSAALRQASEQFWEPLSCYLLTAGWLGLAHCARGLDAAACQTRRPAQLVDSQAASAPILDNAMADCQAASASAF